MATEPTNTRPESVQGPSDWDTALARYRALHQYSDNLAPETPDAVQEDAMDAYCTAMDHLILNVPSPNLSALLEKMRLVHFREGTIEYFWDALVADIKRLDEKASTNRSAPCYVRAVDAYNMAVERALMAIRLLAEAERLDASYDDSREKLLDNAGVIQTAIYWIETELQSAWDAAHPAQENGGAV